MNSKVITVLIIGSQGQLGSFLVESFREKYNVIGLSRNDFDLMDSENFEQYIVRFKPSYVFNCAALVNVDEAEKFPDIASILNVHAPAVLAKLCKNYFVSFIHFSTDYVFGNNNKNSPLSEDESPLPSSVYGQTKREGELEVLKANPDALIFRLSWVFSSREGHNFFKKIISLAKNKSQLNIVNDQFGTPTSVNFISKFLLEFLDIFENGKKFSGIFHLVPSGETTWYYFALSFLGKIRKYEKFLCHQDNIIPSKLVDFKTLANRPQYSVLSNKKFFSILNIEPPTWETELDIVVDEYLKKLPAFKSPS